MNSSFESLKSINQKTLILNTVSNSIFSYLKSQYKLVALGDISSIVTGATPKRNNPKFYNGDIPWVKINDITISGKWVSSTEELITQEALEQNPIKILEKDTVLFSKTGTIGKVAIAAKPLTTNQAIFGIKLKPNSNISSEYLYYYLINSREQMAPQAQGAMIHNLSVKVVKDLLVPIPPKDIVDSVVNLLSAIESGQDISKLTILPQFSQYKQTIVKILQVSAKLEKISIIKEQSKQLINDLIIHLNYHVANQRFIKLHDILKLDDCKAQVLPNNKYELVGIRSFGEGLFDRETIEGKQTNYKYLNLLYEGAIVVSQLKAWEGAIAICEPDKVGKYVSPEYRLFRCIPEQAIPEYLAMLFATSWFLSKIQGVTTGIGGRRERTKMEDFLNISIPMPTITQQRHVVSVIEKLKQLKSLQTITTSSIEALLPSILNSLEKGTR